MHEHRLPVYGTCANFRACNKESGRWVWLPPSGCVQKAAQMDLDMLKSILTRHCISYVGDSLMRQQYESMMCLLGTRGDMKHLATRIRYIQENYLVRSERGVTDKVYGKTRILHWERVYVQQPEIPSFGACKVGTPVVLLGVGQHFLHPGNEYYLNSGVQIDSEIKAYEAAMASVRGALLASTAADSLFFYRTFSPDHFYGGWYYSNGRCSDIQAPYEKPARPEYSRGTYLENHTVDFHDIALRVFNGTRVHALDVTPLSEARGDMHNKIWEKAKQREDCVHWCLGAVPSPPDYWNWLFVLWLVRL